MIVTVSSHLAVEQSNELGRPAVLVPLGVKVIHNEGRVATARETVLGYASGREPDFVAG
jgi:hypothetical protein